MCFKLIMGRRYRARASSGLGKMAAPRVGRCPLPHSLLGEREGRKARHDGLMHRLLVGLDASPRSEAVLHAAIALAQKTSGELVLFRAVGLPAALPPDAR